MAKARNDTKKAVADIRAARADRATPKAQA
jgi:hypothetical protein